MNNHPTKMTAIGALVAVCVSAPSFGGNHGGASPCAQTARTLYAACRLDIFDDYNVSEANCLNLNDDGERRACRREAKTTLREAFEACFDQREARVETCAVLDEERYDPDPLLDPGIEFVDPDDVGPAQANPYVSIVAGHTHVLREEDETIIVHATDETKEINGVTCRVVVDAVVETDTDDETGEVDYEPVEVTDDWLAQDTNGDVYYCGELARNFEDGELTDLDGSFKAGVEGAKSGIWILAAPELGIAHRQEYALGEAEDVVEYVDFAAVPAEENPRFPCSAAGGCLQTYDFTPLEPDVAEYKYYLPGVGFVMGEALEDGLPTGERADLVCIGDSLDVLHDPDCDIDDPDALLEKLCELSPDAFCDDPDDS